METNVAMLQYHETCNNDLPGPKVIKLFSCSTQPSMKFVLLINPKLLTIANALADIENVSANKYETANYC